MLRFQEPTIPTHEKWFAVNAESNAIFDLNKINVLFANQKLILYLFIGSVTALLSHQLRLSLSENVRKIQRSSSGANEFDTFAKSPFQNFHAFDLNEGILKLSQKRES